MSVETMLVVTDQPPAAEDISQGFLQGDVATLQTFTVFEVSGDSDELRQAASFRSEQRTAVLADEIRNPVLNHCPKFETGYSERQDMYRYVVALGYMQELRRSETAGGTLEDDMVDDLIALRINELGFVEAAAMLADGSLQGDDYRRVGEGLKAAGREIYGLPNQQVGLSLLYDGRDSAVALQGSDDEVVAGIARYVSEELQVVPGFEKADPVALDEGLTEYYQGILLEECQDDIEFAFAEIGRKDVYTPQEMQAVFKRYLEKRGYDQAGWTAEVVEGRTSCASLLASRVVEIGAQRSAARCTYKNVGKSMVHEIEIHVRRNARGSRLGSGLAGIGLANYQYFEEPLSGTAEDMYDGKVTHHGKAFIMGIAASAGFDGKERDFRDSFELLWRMSFAEKYNQQKNTQDQIDVARRAAYGNLVRIWRGMPTDVPGCVFTKDRAYENSDFVAYLQNDGRPLPRQDFLRLLEAKYDARNPLQDAYIRELTAQKSDV